jgi:hypothetical protein
MSGEVTWCGGFYQEIPKTRGKAIVAGELPAQAIDPNE